MVWAGLWLAVAVAMAGEAKDDGSVEALRGDVREVDITVEEGTWTSVTVHGDTVVFDLLGDLWSVPLSGGKAVQLTSGPAWDVEPQFSPDGTQLVFTSDRSGNEQIWIADADGANAHALTDESVARLTEPVWDPSGEWILARRRTIDTRSIGVTEIWQYHLEGGKGFALTSFDSHPHAGEMVVDDRHLWFSSRRGRFEYNHNPSAGLWRILRRDRKTGAELPMVWGPGSASRPLPGPKGEWLYFVSRDRDATVLERMRITTGERERLADDLNRDEMEGFALHGTYPRMDFTDRGELVFWSGGTLWRMNPETRQRTAIPYEVSGTWAYRAPTRWDRTIDDTVDARLLRWATPSDDGRIAFSAMGRLWQRRADGQVVPMSQGTGYAPAWGPGGRLAWTSWSDDDGGRLHITHRGRTTTLPLEGQLTGPAWSADGKHLIVLRSQPGSVSPDLGAHRWFEILHLSRKGGRWVTEQVTTTSSRSRAPHVVWHEGRIWFSEAKSTKPRHPSDMVLVSVAPDGTDRREHMNLGGAVEVAPSPNAKWVAFKRDHQVHVAPIPTSAESVAASGALPTVTLTGVRGDWMRWTLDSNALHWTVGKTLHTLPVSAFYAESPTSDDDEEADPFAGHHAVQTTDIDLTVPRAAPRGVTALTHARVLTMNGDEILEDTTVVLDGDRIVSVGGPVPEGATVIDCTGLTVMPGLIDVHAHLHFSSGDILPEQEWRYETNLDFGVTTLHDPSANSDLVFTQAEAVEAGFQKGPRVYSTGTILYGALGNFASDTPSLDAARRHVRRMKAIGARSVKVYQQSQRERRQWYVQACEEEEILCVAEGGGDLWMDLNLAVDGIHAVEHALPVAPLYEDVRQLLTATSGTDDEVGVAYTPTLLVAYGGLGGENYYYQHHDPLDDPRLLAHAPRRVLDATQWRRTLVARDNDWNHQQVAADAAELHRRGVTVTLGAHGQLQGLGAHWELWGLAGPGAMTPHEALRAATIEGARYLGLEDSLGTVSVGKFADLVVLRSDPLADIHASTDIAFVVANGEVWDPSDAIADAAR